MKKTTIINGIVWTMKEATKTTEKNTFKYVLLYKGELGKATTIINSWIIEANNKPLGKYEALDEFLHTDVAKELVYSGEWSELVDYMLFFFKDNDSGRFGKVFEITTKLYLNGYRGNSCIVSPKGKVDLIYKGNKYEVKSNCGELDDIRLSKYVIYTEDSESTCRVPSCGHIFAVDEFLATLNNLGLIRRKKTTAGYIKTTIQTYKNSRKKYTAWTNEVCNKPATATLK